MEYQKFLPITFIYGRKKKEVKELTKNAKETLFFGKRSS